MYHYLNFVNEDITDHFLSKAWMAPNMYTNVWKYRRKKSKKMLTILAVYFVKKVFINGNNSKGIY